MLYSAGGYELQFDRSREDEDSGALRQRYLYPTENTRVTIALGTAIVLLQSQ